MLTLEQALAEGLTTVEELRFCYDLNDALDYANECGQSVEVLDQGEDWALILITTN